MVATYLRDTGRRAGLLGAAIVSCMGLLAAVASVQLAGTKTGTALALAATLGPVLFAISVVSPMTFPFSVYLFLAPFDSMLVLMQSSGSGGGQTLTLLFGAFSGAALLFYMLRTKRFLDPPRELIVWVIYYLWAISSAFWAADVTSTFKLLPTVLSLFVLYAVVSMMRVEARTLRIASVAIVAGGAAASAFMLYMWSHGMARVDDRLWLKTDTMNVNPDHFAASLLVPISLSIVALLHTRSLWTRLAAFGSLAIMLPVMLLSGARGPQVGVAALVVYLFIRDKHRWKLAGAFSVLFAAAVLHAGPANFVSRWTEALSNGGAGRTDIWKVGWLAFKNNWLFGAGFNNFEVAYNQAFIHVFQPLFIGWSHEAHNVELQAAVELGIIGLILLLSCWWVQFRLLKHIDTEDPRYPMRLAAEGGVLALFVSGIFALQMEFKYTWVAFMLCVMIRNTRIFNAPPQQRTILKDA